jgi:hypothetical protein
MRNTSQEQKSSEKVSTIKGVLTRIKRHLRVSLAYLKFILTVQHKDGTSLGTDLIAIACVILAGVVFLPNTFITPFFVSVISELGLLVVILAVLEPISALFERQGE